MEEMKIWYLTCNNAIEYAVVFAENEKKAFEKLITNGNIGTDKKDISMWTIEEFTKDSYNGVLYFY